MAVTLHVCDISEDLALAVKTTKEKIKQVLSFITPYWIFNLCERGTCIWTYFFLHRIILRYRYCSLVWNVCNRSRCQRNKTKHNAHKGVHMPCLYSHCEGFRLSNNTFNLFVIFLLFLLCCCQARCLLWMEYLEGNLQTKSASGFNAWNLAGQNIAQLQHSLCLPKKFLQIGQGRMNRKNILKVNYGQDFKRYYRVASMILNMFLVTQCKRGNHFVPTIKKMRESFFLFLRTFRAGLSFLGTFWLWTWERLPQKLGRLLSSIGKLTLIKCQSAILQRNQTQ